MEDKLFEGREEKNKKIVYLNDKVFFIENKELSLNKDTSYEWGNLNSSTMNLALAILFEVTENINEAFIYQNDFIENFLLQKKLKLYTSTIRKWLKNRDNDILELDNIIENESDSLYPYSFDAEKEELDIRDTSMTIKDITEKVIEGTIITDPDFQRNVVWTSIQKSTFIESIILNIPLPPIYLNLNNKGEYIIVDGLQRTTTLKEFLALEKDINKENGNGFELSNLKLLKQLNGKKFRDLSPLLQTEIKDKKILCYIIRPSVPMKIVYDIFNRINTGGTILNRQEIRNCIFIGPSTILLSHLAEEKYFKNAIDNGVSGKRMKDREVILRYLAFQLFNYKEYNGDMDDFLGKAMKQINSIVNNSVNNFQNSEIYLRKNNKEYKREKIKTLCSIKKIKKLISDFEKVMKISYKIFKKNNFRFPTSENRGRINIALLESVGYFFSRHSEDFLINNQSIIKQNFETLLNDSEYMGAVRTSTSGKKSVQTRFEKAIDILGKGTKYD